MADETPIPQSDAVQREPAPAPEPVPSEPLPTNADPRLVDVREYSEHAHGMALTGDGTPRKHGRDG